MGYTVTFPEARETKDISQIIVFNAKDWANKFKARLLKPGLVSYKDSDNGIVLLKQESIKNSIHTFIGRPLIINHRRTTPATLENDAMGYITDVFFDADDGWWWCSGIVHSDAAKDAIRKMGKVSTGYSPINVKMGKGKEHDISYDQEITSFSGEHLAIVDNPRYEGATIRLNAKNNTHMEPIKWIKKKIASVTNAGETAAQPVVAAEPAAAVTAEPAKPVLENSKDETIDASTTFNIGTETVTLKQLITAWNEKDCGLDGESEIMHNGKAIKLNALLQAFDLWTIDQTNKASKENSKADETVVPAAPKADHYNVLLNASHVASPAKPASFDTKEERLARGQELFGSTPQK